MGRRALVTLILITAERVGRAGSGRVGDCIGRRRRAPRPGDGEPDLGAVLMGQRRRHLCSGNSE